MKKIPKTFNKNGMIHTLIQRSDTVALYKSSVNNDIRGYDVHKIRQKRSSFSEFAQSDGSIRKLYLPEREILAGNEEFGMYGWSYDTKETAKKKFEELTNSSKNE